MTLEVVPPITTTPEPELSTEFNGHIQGLKGLATVYDLLNKGAFPHAYRYQIEHAIAFVQELHSQSTEAALIHPEADKVPDLVALKEARAKKAVEETVVKKAEEKRLRKMVKVKGKKKCLEE